MKKKMKNGKPKTWKTKAKHLLDFEYFVLVAIEFWSPQVGHPNRGQKTTKKEKKKVVEK